MLMLMQAVKGLGEVKLIPASHMTIVKSIIYHAANVLVFIWTHVSD